MFKNCLGNWVRPYVKIKANKQETRESSVGRGPDWYAQIPGFHKPRQVCTPILPAFQRFTAISSYTVGSVFALDTGDSDLNKKIICKL